MFESTTQLSWLRYVLRGASSVETAFANAPWVRQHPQVVVALRQRLSQTTEHFEQEQMLQSDCGAQSCALHFASACKRRLRDHHTRQ